MKWDAPAELVTYLRANPSSEDRRAAADMIEAQRAEIAAMRAAARYAGLSFIKNENGVVSLVQLVKACAGPARVRNVGAALSQVHGDSK